MCFGLRKSDVIAIRQVFSRYPALEKALLYGSRATGNYRGGSDIDLTLTGDRLNLALLSQIETDLDELQLPYKIDLSLFNAIDNPALLEHINRVGIVFYPCVGGGTT